MASGAAMPIAEMIRADFQLRLATSEMVENQEP